MKKLRGLFVFLFLTFVLSNAVYADNISCDKSDFAKVSSVIDDVVYDIRHYSSYALSKHIF